MNKRCPHCGKEYPEVSRYCPYCGSPNPAYVVKEENKLHFKRQILLFFVGFLVFQIIGTLIQIGFIMKGRSLFGNDATAITNYIESAPVSMFVNSIAYCAVFCLLLIVALPNVQNLIKSFKNKKAYIGTLLAFAMIYAFNIFYSVFLALIGVKTDANNNQQTLDSVVKVYPIISLIVFGFIGPVCEELTYRFGLFDFFKRRNRVLAYVLTILIFTFIHFDFAATNIVNELINVPYYVAAAFAFTYAFDNYGFAASVTAHVANNVFSVVRNLI